MVTFTVFKGSKDGSIVESTTTKDIKPDEVLIKVTHSGLCGTDEHYKHQDMVLGHEGAGLIQEVGTSVKNFAVGDSVGWGFQHDCCTSCKQCLTGRETLCSQRTLFGYNDFDQGSFATHAVWKESFVYHIPASIPREYAAPLQCGGATVFNALTQFNAVKPAHRVGVIGIGGLGHLAVQFAAKMGAEVVVFSGTDSKKAEAIKLGASEFVATKGVEVLAISAPVDHLIVTASFQPNWEQFLPVLAPGATIYPLSVSADDLKLPYMPIIAGELRIQGSLVAARHVHRDMLAFAAHHQIRPIIELYPMTIEGITTSMKKLDEGHMRYRGVLVVQHKE